MGDAQFLLLELTFFFFICLFQYLQKNHYMIP